MVLVGLDAAEHGVVNPWGGDQAVAFGGKHGVVGGGAIALSTLEPLQTYAAPEDVAAVGAFDSGASILAMGASSELWLYDRTGDAPCTVTVTGGPFKAVALTDLGGGTLGIATVVAGELMMFTSDLL